METMNSISSNMGINKVIYMKKKSLHLSDAVFIIAFSTIFLGALFSVGLYLIFRFKIIILVLLLFLFVLTGGVIILLGKIIIEKPIREFEKSMRSLSLSVRPVATLSRLNEIRNINRAIRKLWLQSHQMTSCLFSTIELYSVGFFYYLKEDDKVYCTQKFFDICAFKGKEGYLDYRKFHPMYQKITNLYYDDKYRAYLLEDFRWIQILTHQYRGFCMGIIYDITDQVNQIKKIEKERDIDPLTGLYNRYAFNRLAENIISDCSIKALALIMWDIDKLKYINDTYGHDVGDRYLCKFGEVIKSLEQYGGLVARRSGDEFLALVYGNEQSQIQPIIDEVNRQISEGSILIGDCVIEKLRASFGVAWYPENGTVLADLINYADFALYENKYYLFVKPRQDSINASIVNYSKEFNYIIANKLVTFSYQPIIDAKTAKILGHETFMRIYSDIIRTPEQLITVAKAQSKLHVVEEMTLEKCIAAIREYQNILSTPVFIHSLPNIILPDLSMKKIFVNLNNIKIVFEIIDYYYADKEIFKNKLEKLKCFQIEVCLDDFTIDNINEDIISFVNYIKLDMSLVRSIDVNRENQEKLRRILDYARNREIKVIAKGIESYQEMQYLMDIGVDYLQGYYIAMPLSRPNQISKDVIDKHQAIANQKNKKGRIIPISSS